MYPKTAPGLYAYLDLKTRHVDLLVLPESGGPYQHAETLGRLDLGPISSGTLQEFLTGRGYVSAGDLLLSDKAAAYRVKKQPV